MWCALHEIVCLTISITRYSCQTKIHIWLAEYNFFIRVNFGSRGSKDLNSEFQISKHKKHSKVCNIGVCGLFLGASLQTVAIDNKLDMTQFLQASPCTNYRGI